MMKIVSFFSFPIPSGDAVLSEMYREKGISYPKFFKMDILSKSGFLAAEEVLGAAGLRNEEPKPDMGIVLVNSTSSSADDVAFQRGLKDEEYFPSPALFVYTLSNIVCGEIAIRNRILGETSFYIDSAPCPERMIRYVKWTFADEMINKVLLGWVEVFEGGRNVTMMLVEKDSAEGEDFTVEYMEKIMK